MYKAELINDMTVYAVGENARSFHKTAVEMRQRGQRGHEHFEACSQGDYEDLAKMRSVLLAAAHSYTARWAASPANKTTEQMVKRFMARVEQIDEYLGGGQ